MLKATLAPHDQHPGYQPTININFILPSRHTTPPPPPPLQAEDRMRWGAAAAQALSGAVQGCGQAVLVFLYRFIIEQAEAGSPAHRAFESFATGCLRLPMLRFFADASDFTRRLVSVEANGKFAGIDAGPDAPLG